MTAIGFGMDPLTAAYSTFEAWYGVPVVGTTEENVLRRWGVAVHNGRREQANRRAQMRREERER
eukprot:CAMPEP_0175078274 /NCGR_PEP_ID=MMETSP0052_2-20121109/24006_1 /TAXON_ID=51329 ORGANISM="Polytomella parva, Strain SAG 63-3" /NCGR_SAMPLE_ID=MMETSP0052_2 /ASSEMBLY_ACC=CAM_ASM_000194 /LENGTH=63 /DNA_ID=CAMNT_0016348135 /DNA_START=13 /DNA_END=200 /DNA_ORIENTATION=+